MLKSKSHKFIIIIIIIIINTEQIQCARDCI